MFICPLLRTSRFNFGYGSSAMLNSFRTMAASCVATLMKSLAWKASPVYLCIL